MDFRGGGKKIVVVDENPIHFRAFQEIIKSVQGVDFGTLHASEGRIVESADLFLLSLDLREKCSKHLLQQILQTHSTSLVICYSHSIPTFCYGGFDEYHNRLVVMNHSLIIEHLVDLVDCFMKGNVLPTVGQLLRTVEEIDEEGKCSVEKLSPREKEIFCLFGAGCDATETSKRLEISKNTVDVHIKGAKRKLGARNAVELRMLAILYARSSSCLTLSESGKHICLHRKSSIGDCPFHS